MYWEHAAHAETHETLELAKAHARAYLDALCESGVIPQGYMTVLTTWSHPRTRTYVLRAIVMSLS